MATTITRESMTDNVTVWNVTRIGSAIYDRIDTVLGANITFGGLVGSEGFGAHSFSASGTGANILRVRNLTAGTTNYSALEADNDSGTSRGRMMMTSSTYTPTGGTILDAADALLVYSNGVGGIAVGAGNASGSLRLYSGGALRLLVSSAGVITPISATMLAGFFAYNSADDTGVANNTDIDFDTEVYDEGGHFSGDTFTAPVTGRYLLSAHVRLTNSTGGAIIMQPVFLVSNHASGINIGYDSSVASGATKGFSGSVIVDMDASDTATVRYYGGGNCTVVGGGSQRVTWFSGRLVL